jgi:protein-S-isoprenylcysteine O-methyltransferase Ste14
MDRKDLWTIGGDGVRWMGVAVFTAGSLLRIWPVFVLGHRFSGLVAIQQGHTLVTGGIYRVIRHPSYLGLIAGSVGWGLVFRSTVGVLLAFALIPVLAGRIRAEEKLLSAHFGEAYERYRASTPMFFPRL